ncbi:hypothetical protein HQ393_13865 [Chitinibacter bivalviorum]|uniref:Uncharacterized protein n=1 Tax=Chitinibacter bivalviorum TaxID=2739434 RepID=A0A7H9BL54_9NEIS|nr:hypothetical protein [Chitinibacter bivalviorum]QLG89239.1 hypothetical protein HQ393_13865 [Chitinibacter bivalviorum]
MKTINQNFNRILLLGLVFIGWYYFKSDPLRVDENTNFSQIITYSSGKLVHDPFLTSVSGYHYLMSWIVRAFHSESTALLRGMSALLGLGSIAALHYSNRLLNQHQHFERVVQFAVFPTIFPFFFLIYNDIASLCFVLAGMYFCLRQRYSLGISILILSMGMRQNNVLWLLAIPALCWLMQTDFVFNKQNILAFMRRCWLIGVGLIGFAIFVVLNHGVAMGDRSMHPPFALNSGNAFFFLFCYCVILLPLVLSRTKENIRFAMAQRHIGLMVALFFALYLFAFSNTHPYNNLSEDLFIRNWILMKVFASFWLKMLFFIPIALAALDLARSMQQRPPLRIVVLASLLFLMLSWLIEPRYYMISFALIMLFRPDGSPNAEKMTSMYCALLSILVIYVTHQNMLFL